MVVRMMTTMAEKPLVETRLKISFVDWTRRRLPQRPDYELQPGSRYANLNPAAVAWAGPLGAYVDMNGSCLMARLISIATSSISEC